MNKQESDVLRVLITEPYVNQRILAESCGHSLGVVNRCLKNLKEEGYLDEQFRTTGLAKSECSQKAPKNAIILAAGLCTRMLPINIEYPKALLEINGEPLIERLITQLHEVGIYEIYVVVGLLKEQFEYLIDEFGVNLVINTDYASKNNLHSLRLVLDHLSNSYVIPCDIWCSSNPFRRNELNSWYMVSELMDRRSTVRVNRKEELVCVKDEPDGNEMIGIAYLLEKEAAVVRRNIERMCQDPHNDNQFWETALIGKKRMIVDARIVSSADVVEINTYEQLRELDRESKHLKTEHINLIAEVFHVKTDDITDITVLKRGMTNRSFLFSCKGSKYIMRIPGEGTGRLINRKEEAQVFNVIGGKNICEEIIYFDSENGYKITRYIENAHNCDPFDPDETGRCMQRLRQFHEMRLSVRHEFDIFAHIDFYESLWNGAASIYRDYGETKANVYSLRSFIEAHVEEKVLTHIDAVCDNFLLTPESDGEETIRLIDWEYAAMQDPHVDIAMFCIYALYDREHVDQLIDAYFTEGCPREIRIKIYCYIAACGLLWSNWCEYKRRLKVEFGEYSIRQYRYAKEYYRIVRKELENSEGDYNGQS